MTYTNENTQTDLKKTSNIYSNADCYQAHPYHLVSPSPWPILTSLSL